MNTFAGVFIGMKKAISYLLIILFANSILRPALPYMEYFFNYEYISTILCINKEEPTLNCDGKCYLMTQLAKATEEKKPENQSIPSIEFEKFPVFIHYLNKMEISHNLFHTNTKNWNYKILEKSDLDKPNTPPPKLICT
ncbi:hypothetical protein [Ascidiimonas sp. W6]|uniref:hypothetical protein n=1 Tax=Ascidiimonas meishanensis TaxID=3128903 RepID=UPI0030EEE788